MAENNTARTYDYKGTELDLDKLVSNLDKNAQHYIEYMGWDSRKASDFMSAFDQYYDALKEGRLSSDKYGRIMDSAGKLSNGDPSYVHKRRGDEISGTEYDELKRRQQRRYGDEFYANIAAAGFIDTIAKQMAAQKAEADKSAAEAAEKAQKKADEAAAKAEKDAAEAARKAEEEAAEARKFNNTTNGFYGSFLNYLAPSGSDNIDMAALIDMDEQAKDGTRPTTNRANYMAKFIEQYLPLVDNIDFTGTSYGSADEYKKRLDTLYKQLTDGTVDANDYLALQAVGMNPKWYRQYFASSLEEAAKAAGRETGQNTPAQSDDGQETSALKITDDMRGELHSKWYNDYDAKPYTEQDAPIDLPFKKFNLAKGQSDWVKALKDNALQYGGAYQDALDYMDPVYLRYDDGSDVGKYIKWWFDHASGNFMKLSGERDYPFKGWYLVKGSDNIENGTVLLYNPSTNKVLRVLYGKLTEGGLRDYLDDYRKFVDRALQSAHSVSTSQSWMNIGAPDDNSEEVVPSHQQGGSIEDFLAGKVEEGDQKQSSESPAAEVDPNYQKFVPGGNSDGNQFTAGMSASDWTRLAGLTADVLAMCIPDVVATGVLGFGSVGTNLAADIMDKKSAGKVIGNAALNTGLTLLSCIPVAGSASSALKAFKGLKGFHKFLVGALGAASAVGLFTNAGEIKDSLSKIGKSGAGNEMSIQDWRNIAQLLQFVLGFANAGRTQAGKGAFDKLKAQSRIVAAEKGPSLALDVSLGGSKKKLLVNEKDNYELFNAILEGNPDKINTILKNNYTVNGQAYQVAVQEVKTPEVKHLFKKNEPEKIERKLVEGAVERDPINYGDKAVKGVGTATVKGVRQMYNESNPGFLSSLRRMQRRVNKEADAHMDDKYVRAKWSEGKETQGKNASASPQNGTPEFKPVSAKPNTERYKLIESLSKKADALESSTLYNTRLDANQRSLAQDASAYAGSAARGGLKDDTVGTLESIKHSEAFETLTKGALSADGKTRSAGVLSEEEAIGLGLWKQGGSLPNMSRIYKMQAGGSGSLLNLGINPYIVGKKKFGVDLSEGLSGQRNYGNTTDYSGQRNYESMIDSSWLPSQPQFNWEPPLQFLYRGTSSNGQAPAEQSSVQPSSFNYGTNFTYNESENGRGEYDGDKYGNLNWQSIDEADESSRFGELTPHTQHGEGETLASVAKSNRTLFGNDGMRENNFLNWAKAYWKDGMSAEDLIGEYNRQYQNMRDARWKYLGSRDNSNVYNHNEEDDNVGRFNDLYNAIYSGINGKNENGNGLMGWDEGTKKIYGTASASRPYDITDEDVALDFSNYLEGLDEGLKNALSGITKNKEGFMYISGSTEPQSQEDNEAPASDDQGEPGNENSEGNEGLATSTDTGTGSKNTPAADTRKKVNLPWADMLSSLRLLGTLGHNHWQYENALKMPVNLYNPMEFNKNVYGNYGAIQSGMEASGLYNHLASIPTTSDYSSMAAAQLEAARMGQEAIRKGQAQNDAQIETTRAASETQRKENQTSRYSTAERNRGNLFNKKVQDNQAKAAWRRANYNSLDNYLSGIESKVLTKQQEELEEKEAIEKRSLQNKIYINPSAYGLTMSDEETAAVQKILGGQVQYADLSDEEKKAFDTATIKVNQKLTEEWAKRFGVEYVPYIRGKGEYEMIRNGGVIGYLKRGGSATGESEKVAIQRMRTKVAEMQARQKRLETIMNAYEKDMDRAYKSASSYVKSQKGKSK